MFAMKNITALLMLALSVALIVAAAEDSRTQSQSSPDLSGTWELIEFGGSRKADDVAGFPKVTLVFLQTATEIRITLKVLRRGIEQTQEFTYYADGRGETNAGRIQFWPQNQSNVESVTEWSKGKLLTRYKQRRSVMEGIPRSDKLDGAKEEWRLASDGKTLEMKISSVQTAFPPISGSSNMNDALAPKATFNERRMKFKKVS
jgi:hypothetical protein